MNQLFSIQSQPALNSNFSTYYSSNVLYGPLPFAFQYSSMQLQLAIPSSKDEHVYSKLVYPSPETGFLNYWPYNEYDDRVADFSNVGYNEGLQDPPRDVPVVLRLDPSDCDENDASRIIQEAIDTVAKRPLDKNGFRGAIQLERGIYNANTVIYIKSSGIVLQGDPAGGTVIYSKISLTTNGLLEITGRPDKKYDDTKMRVTDEWVPIGSKILHLEDVSPFNVGDEVLVSIRSNEAWLKLLNMDDIVPRDPTIPHYRWLPENINQSHRVIRAIDYQNKSITIDIALTMRIEAKYGGAFVRKITSNRISRIGIQDIEFVHPSNEGRGPDKIDMGSRPDYRHAPEMFENFVIVMDNIENAWVRAVTSRFFRNTVRLKMGAIRITITDTHHIFPSPPKIPDSNIPHPYISGQNSFSIGGELILITGCSADYSYHAYVVQARVPGPNVVHNCTATGSTGSADTGPHMHWSTGQLYDNLIMDGALLIQDRWNYGTGQGWSGANCLCWNSEAGNGIIVQNPPTAKNFAVGCSAKKGRPRIGTHEWGWWESPGYKVEPRSLWEAQLEDRKRRIAMGGYQ